MVLIRCTAKLLREIGVKPSKTSDDESDGTILGPWHANLLHIDRRKCLLFVNDRTLFNFLIPDVPRTQIRDVGSPFRLWLSCILSEERVPASTIKRILAEADEVRIAASSSRRVLGSANDLAFHYKSALSQSGGVHSVRLPTIIQELNRMPMGAIGMNYSIDELRKACAVAA
ncbi:MAG TPA: hypothetical protein VNQ32_00780 [Steroidobacteraceae bacterium]|nr:hypothetical protein [Steroidobacteraceae bacterium]